VLPWRQRWSIGAAVRTPPEISLAPDDLAPLRQVREDVRALTGRGEVTSSPLAGAQLTLSLEPGGRLAYRPAGSGWRGVAALAAAEILLAQQRGQ